jgi:hypothetical protein
MGYTSELRRARVLSGDALSFKQHPFPIGTQDTQWEDD